MRRTGFTLLELTAILAVGAALTALGAIAQPTKSKGKDSAWRKGLTKEEAMIRGIHQGMVVWAQNNKDLYPLPSAIDKQDYTVKEKGRAKDTTANIYSIMVYCGSLSTELFISPAEISPNIGDMRDYEFDKPKAAANPAKALWDPRFSAELDGSRKGNTSYAHLQPSGDRRKRWTNSFNAAEQIVSNRGPEVQSVEQAETGAVTPTFAKTNSRTLKINGDGTSWSGHVVYNDNSVKLIKDKLKSGRSVPMTKDESYTDAQGKKHADIWFYDEPDPKSANTFLGLFTKAGDSPKDFKAAWD